MKLGQVSLLTDFHIRDNIVRYITIRILTKKEVMI